MCGLADVRMCGLADVPMGRLPTDDCGLKKNKKLKMNSKLLLNTDHPYWLIASR